MMKRSHDVIRFTQVKWEGACLRENISRQTVIYRQCFKPYLFSAAALTCLKRWGYVGGGAAVIREGCNIDLIILTTFQLGHLAAGGSWCTVQGSTGTINSCGSVRVGPTDQIPTYCHRVSGAAVVHGHCCHRQKSWKKVRKYFKNGNQFSEYLQLCFRSL